MIRLDGIRYLGLGPRPIQKKALEYVPGTTPAIRLMNELGVLSATATPSDHTTGNKTWLDQRIVRNVARASWNGNPDDVISLQHRDLSAGSGIGGLRCAFFKNFLDTPGNVMWMRTVDIEMDNRGILADRGVALRIGVRSNNPDVTTGVAGLELELLGQAQPTSGYLRGIDLVHNDASHVTSPTGIVLRAPSSSDGFVFGIDVQANGLKKNGPSAATSAFARLVDDSENADLASAIGSVNGALKVVIGSTVAYIPTYDGYTPA